MKIGRINIKRRWIAAGIVLLLMAILWVELAVDLFGSPIAGS